MNEVVYVVLQEFNSEQQQKIEKVVCFAFCFLACSSQRSYWSHLLASPPRDVMNVRALYGEILNNNHQKRSIKDLRFSVMVVVVVDDD